MIVANLAVRAARKRLVVRSVGVLIAVLIASVADADTVRVTVDRALIWNTPAGVSIVLTQVTKGTLLQMRQRVGEWYEVVLPPGSSRDTRDVGYIRASQVVVEPGDLPPAPTSGARPAPPAGGAQPAAPGDTLQRSPPTAQQGLPSASSSTTTFVNIDATYRRGTPALTRSVPAFESLYAEAGEIAANYGRGTGLQLDVMGGRSIWRQIGIGVGFSYYQRERPARVDADVPHPFFFNQLRPAAFTTAGLKRQEIGIHIPVLWMPEFNGPLKIMVFGGPAFFRVEQRAVTDVTLDESYPYDVVAINGVQTEAKSGTSFGFNTGADLAFMIARTVGVGVGVRYGRAQIEFRNDASAATDGDAGGLHFVVGLRYRF